MNSLSSIHKETAPVISIKADDTISTMHTEYSIKEDHGASLSSNNCKNTCLGTRSILKTQTTWHQTNFWFGTLHIHGTRRTVQTQGAKSGDLITSEENSQTDLKFIPARWLLRKGAIATITWITKNFQQPVVSMGLQVFNVVARDSQIIEACKACDLAIIQRFFDERIASPLDRDANGYILTDWAIYPMIERLAIRETPWIKDLRRCFGVCRFLIDTCGLDPSQSQAHKWAASNRRTAWSTLLMFQIANRGHKHAAAAAPWFERILRLLICKARTNPFAQAKHSFADVLELQTRHLDNPIVDSSFSILAGQEMWSIEWDDSLSSETMLEPGYVYCPTAIQFIESRMIPAAIVASEAAARSLVAVNQVQESFRKWSVILEKVLEDDPGVDDDPISDLFLAIIESFDGYVKLNPADSISKIFKASIKTLMLCLMQCAEKRKVSGNKEERQIEVDGYGTWKVSDVWKEIVSKVFET